MVREIRELELLKQRNLPSYQKAIHTRKEKVKHRLQEWREKKQDRLDRFLKRERELRQKRLDHFKQHQPEFYNQFREKRLNKMERLADHPRFKEKYEKFQRKKQERQKERRPHVESKRRLKTERPARRTREGHGW